MRLRPLRDSAACAPETLRRRAATDGYLFLRAAVPRARVTRLRRRVEAACAARGWLDGGRTDPALRLGAYDDPRWIAFLQEVMDTAAYRALGRSPEIRAVLAALWEDEPVPHVGDLCRLVSPRAVELTTPPHQDAAYLRASGEAWTAWLPLGACPLPLGPLAVLPGSHRDGVRPHEPVAGVHGVDVGADPEWASGDLEAGDVLLFASTTIHRALPNLTADRLRMSVDYRYRPRRALAA